MRNGIQRLSVIMLILLSMTILIMTGCDKGKLKTNTPPTIQITSYEGADSLAEDLPQQSFQAKIFWRATDTDGTIKGFAFRVLDLNGNPIPTPGYSAIDEDGSFTPDEVRALYPNKYGWVLHYKPGADQSIALDSIAASKKTIWTTQKYALINFPAADANGNPIPKISKFELICIDNRNAVSNLAVRYFNATSNKPEVTLTTTKGNPDGGTVGTGLKLSFGIIDHDPFLTSIATHYEFAIYKKNLSNGSFTPSGTDTTWVSTYGLPRINEYKLTRLTSPALVPDFDENGTQITETWIYARAFDLAGIKSNTKLIKFAVKEGFRPQTLIYDQRILALGDNHYIDYLDDSTPEVLPYVYTSSGAHYATPFFMDTQGRHTAVYSPNVKVTLRWGWHGEYGTTSAAGVPTTTDNPYDRKQDNVLDSLHANYYSEVVGFDIRLDNDMYNFPPLMIPSRTIIDSPAQGGKRWLRVFVTDPIAQSLVLTNLAPGRHIFEVRAIDLQDEYDPTPAVFVFYLVPPVTNAQRHNVLIVDDDKDNSSFNPEATVDGLYDSFIANSLSQYGITSSQIEKWTGQLQITGDIRGRVLAYSDLMNYKLIIYHSDGSSTPVLDQEHDGLSLYLKSGGNMVVSGGGLLNSVAFNIAARNQTLLYDFFGLGYSAEAIQPVSASYSTKPWFINAIPLDTTYPQIAVNTTTSFNPIVNSRGGLGPVGYLTAKSPDASFIYSYGCKTVGQDTYSPTNQADYDLLNGKPVGLKKTTSSNKCFMFTFPLAYMQTADVQSLFTRIFTEVYGSK